jgi:hypothetical protein
LLRLNVPPGTVIVVQQFTFAEMPHVAAIPEQLGAEPHTPAPLHTGVLSLHGVAAPHAPLASHICGLPFEHRFVPCAQTPMHDPAPVQV